MEFTKENIIKLLTDARDTFFKLSKENKEKYKKLENEGQLRICDYYEGRAQALESVSFYLDDIIQLIKIHMITTEDLIDKENTNA